MLTDTFTAHAFFVDFIADPTRALRWTTLRQDSGDPYTFVKEAKEAWKTVEDRAGVERVDGVVAKGKRVIFSDGLDVDRAVMLQTQCDELGIAGAFFFFFFCMGSTSCLCRAHVFRSVIWHRDFSHQRFSESLGYLSGV